MHSINFSTLVVGFQGSGKTTFSHKLSLAYPRKVLAISPDDRETIFSPYPDLLTDGDHKIRRAIYQKDMNRGLLRFNNGLLIFDDCRYYVGKHDHFFTQLMIRKRQHNRDMLFVVHSIFDFPPSLMQFINGIYIFPFFDTPERLKGRIYDFPRFEKIWKEVNETKIPKYFPIFV
jgi:hypothetical protein